MFENYRAWRKKSEKKMGKVEQHDWGTIVHLIVNKGGREWFFGYVYGAMWWFACIAFFFGAALGASIYRPGYTLVNMLSDWWPWILGAGIVGVLIELKTHSIRGFYRERRALYGSWFR